MADSMEMRLSKELESLSIRLEQAMQARDWSQLPSLDDAINANLAEINEFAITRCSLILKQQVDHLTKSYREYLTMSIFDLKQQQENEDSLISQRIGVLMHQPLANTNTAIQ